MRGGGLANEAAAGVGAKSRLFGPSAVPFEHVYKAADVGLEGRTAVIEYVPVGIGCRGTGIDLVHGMFSLPVSL